ncbi:MAG TPA: flagellar hook assembly protein FlgD [Hyphomicrobiaceae bacterium]|nr:flagellar hook assembly protein FlgD [Hyphomicrobiaceae bacterium]
MQVGTATATNPSTSQTTQASSSIAPDYNAFLRLLVAQLKNQDPTKPIDSTQYMAQLAAFSNVEQSMQTNAKLDSLMTSFALSQAESLIGRTITSADGSVSGKVQSVSIISGGAVAKLDTGDELPLGAGIKIS